LDITWLGHACFRLRGREAAVITDPYARTLGLTLGRQTANVVTISHEAPYHAAVDQIGGEPRVLRGPGEYEIAGVMISGVATPGERQEDGSYGRNTAFAVTIDDIVVCHLGVLGKKLTTEQIEALKDPDVLLIPAGGGQTIPLTELAEVVSQLEPKIVVPMQYAVAGLSLAREPIERFCREMAVQEQRFLPRLTVTRSSVPDDTTVTLLETAAARRPT
jgi:L-ascorbate metabolism protein UlaG (beta-lactamase superfamily)